MATYLASFGDSPLSEAAAERRAHEVVASAAAQGASLRDPAQRLFDGACGACHHDGDGPKLLGVNLPLALNSNLHSARPDNLIRVILDGIREPASRDIGFMPAFRHSLSDGQIAALAAYMRRRFAPDKAAWSQIEATVARVRALH
jgi:nicotinate dehydrogenase subunit B